MPYNTAQHGPPLRYQAIPPSSDCSQSLSHQVARSSPQLPPCTGSTARNPKIPPDGVTTAQITVSHPERLPVYFDMPRETGTMHASAMLLLPLSSSGPRLPRGFENTAEAPGLSLHLYRSNRSMHVILTTTTRAGRTATCARARRRARLRDSSIHSPECATRPLTLMQSMLHSDLTSCEFMGKRRTCPSANDTFSTWRSNALICCSPSLTVMPSRETGGTQSARSSDVSRQQLDSCNSGSWKTAN
jgi:hypothetical protein